jgi:hypothetical protein
VLIPVSPLFIGGDTGISTARFISHSTRPCPSTPPNDRQLDGQREIEPQGGTL